VIKAKHAQTKREKGVIGYRRKLPFRGINIVNICHH